MPFLTRFTIKFAISLIVTTIICTTLWQEVVNENLYDCTDAFGFDYWEPGHWVHGNFITVNHIIHHRSMSEPDTIKEGWTMPRLWQLWYSFVLASVATSLLLACIPWVPKRT